MKQPVLGFIFIGAGFLLTQLSTSLLAPALPSMTIALGCSNAQIKFLLCMFLIGYAGGQFLWGPLSDYFKRKSVWLIATGLYCIVCPPIYFLSSIYWLYLFYALVGFMTAAHTGVGNAIIKDSVPKQQLTRAIAAAGLILSCGPSIGSALGTTLVVHYSWPSVFLTLSLLAGITFIGSLCFVSNSTNKPAQNNHSFFTGFKNILRNKQFVGCAIILSLSFSVLVSYLNIMPFIFSRYLKLSTHTSGMLLMISTVSYILAALVVMLSIKKTGPFKQIKIGLSLFLFASLCLLTIAITGYKNIIAITLCSTTLLFAVGLLVPCSKGACMSSVSEYIGTAASCMKCLQVLGAIAVTFISSQINSSSSFIPSALLFVGCALIALLGFNLARSKPSAGG